MAVYPEETDTDGDVWVATKSCTIRITSAQ
jgi:hypothetical protein